MSADKILHIAEGKAWEAAQKQGKYTADSLAEQGFIHCSKCEQVLRVANAFYHDSHGLVLLVIDPGRLTSELRWEPGDDLKSQVFPHLYGPLNLDAVVQAIGFEPREDGTFTLPEELSC